MRLDLLGLYGGPDQVMGVTSGIAGLLGILLLFWNRVVGIFFRIVDKVRGTTHPAATEAPKNPPAGTV
jgi:hypothetical protein